MLLEKDDISLRFYFYFTAMTMLTSIPLIIAFDITENHMFIQRIFLGDTLEQNIINILLILLIFDLTILRNIIEILDRVTVIKCKQDQQSIRFSIARENRLVLWIIRLN